METLRLPKVGDFVFVSSLDKPEEEYKYIIAGVVDDGYHILPEGVAPEGNTSMIKYSFANEKWYVAGAAETHVARIEKNPLIRENLEQLDLSHHWKQITDSITDGRFEDAERYISEYQGNYIPQLLTVTYGTGENLYANLGIKYPAGEAEFFDALEWLKRNHFVDYAILLEEAVSTNRSDLIEWILRQTDEIVKMKSLDIGQIWDLLDETVLFEDDPDILPLLSQFPGLFEGFDDVILGRKTEPDDPSNMIEYMEKEYPTATYIPEFLKSVPPKAVQSKHLS
jgi:hypothetical protein